MTGWAGLERGGVGAGAGWVEPGYAVQALAWPGLRGRGGLAVGAGDRDGGGGVVGFQVIGEGGAVGLVGDYEVAVAG